MGGSLQEIAFIIILCPHQEIVFSFGSRDQWATHPKTSLASGLNAEFVGPFIAKNQLSSLMGAENEGDHILCPVLCDVTSDVLKHNTSPENTFSYRFLLLRRQEVNCNGISLWLWAVILQAYEVAGANHSKANNPYEISLAAAPSSLLWNCVLALRYHLCQPYWP